MVLLYQVDLAGKGHGQKQTLLQAPDILPLVFSNPFLTKKNELSYFGF
jgi:hypothetical protein